MSGISDNREELRVFRLSHELAIKIYKLTMGFPSAERFGLAAQMRKAAAVIPASIAEGYSRLDRYEFKKMVEKARTSTSAINYQLKLAHELKILDKTDYDELSVKYFIVGRMLMRLARTLSRPEAVNG